LTASIGLAIGGSGGAVYRYTPGTVANPQTSSGVIIASGGYGSGGYGAAAVGPSSALAGANGMPGIVIITEYISV
jgi:hypothetical protein